MRSIPDSVSPIYVVEYGRAVNAYANTNTPLLNEGTPLFIQKSSICLYSVIQPNGRILLGFKDIECPRIECDRKHQRFPRMPEHLDASINIRLSYYVASQIPKRVYGHAALVISGR